MIASTEATSSDESGRSREGPRALAFETTMEELAAYMRGWCGYFGFSETPGAGRSHSLGPVAAAGCALAPVENSSLSTGLSNAYFKSLGLLSLFQWC